MWNAELTETEIVLITKLRLLSPGAAGILYGIESQNLGPIRGWGLADNNAPETDVQAGEELARAFLAVLRERSNA